MDLKDPGELEALRAEVRDLTARRDIHLALNAYMRGQDRLLPELQRSSLYEDGWVDCGIFSGRAWEFVDFAQNFLGSCDASQHQIGQADIQVNGNHATGEVYFIAHHRINQDGEKADLFVGGRYHDEYQNRGDGWKISRRKEIVDWARTDPAADSFLADQPDLNVAARGENG